MKTTYEILIQAKRFAQVQVKNKTFESRLDKQIETTKLENAYLWGYNAGKTDTVKSFVQST